MKEHTFVSELWLEDSDLVLTGPGRFNLESRAQAAQWHWTEKVLSFLKDLAGVSDKFFHHSVLLCQGGQKTWQIPGQPVFYEAPDVSVRRKELGFKDKIWIMMTWVCLSPSFCRRKVMVTLTITWDECEDQWNYMKLPDISAECLINDYYN